MAISMLKIRRPLGRLIFNMGIAIPGKTVFLIETAPWLPFVWEIILVMYGLTLSGGNENAGHMTASNSKKENEYTLQSVNNDIKCDSSSGCLGYGE